MGSISRTAGFSSPTSAIRSKRRIWRSRRIAEPTAAFATSPKTRRLVGRRIHLPIAPAARALGYPAPPAAMKAQVFQNAVCNWRCWYCFVDFELLAGNPKRAAWLSADDLLDLYLAESDRPNVIDLSGGQPDLVPEWIDWMMTALRERELEAPIYLWSDDNLSNDYFFSKLNADSRRRIDGYANYGKVCCFKGFDADSFAFNTRALPSLFDRQFDLMGRLIRETEIDLYCYTTFTAPRAEGIAEAMSIFVDRLQALDENLPLRTVPLQVSVFSPVQTRLETEHHRALIYQEEAAAAWEAELVGRYSDAARAQPIVDVALRG